jgi:hypothetical protein
MRFLSWLRNSTRSQAPARSRTYGAARQRATFRPHLEALERRDVPSTLTVTTAADSGAGSLRAEIAAAKNKDTIVFAPSLDGQTITLTSAELAITKNRILTIQGPGAGLLAISGNYQSNPLLVQSGVRVFEVDGATVTIAGLTICNGFAGDGGGILNHGGNVTVNNCALTNNYAGFGGAIVNWFGTLTISGCTLTGNQFTNPYGQVGGGAIFNYQGSRATITNCTISGNSGTVDPGSGTFVTYGDGGGIYNDGSMTLSGTTVTQNTGYDYAGGIYEDSFATLSIIQGSNVSGNNGADLVNTNGVTISSDSHVGVIILY